MTGRSIAAFFAGVLAANAIPHAFTCATGANGMTPLAGRDSSPLVNGVWSAMNVVGSLAIMKGTLAGANPAERRSFRAGVAAFSTWVLVSERFVDFDS